MPRHTERTTYCRQQAVECARAASDSIIAEVKEAYLNLEQGWLKLAPELADSPPPSTSEESIHVQMTSKPGQPRRRRTRR